MSSKTPQSPNQAIKQSKKTGRIYQDATIACLSGIAEDKNHGAVIPPIYLSSNFIFPKFEEKGRYDYTRSGNPTRDVFAETLAALEGGYGASINASGMAAVNLVLSLIKVGETVFLPHDCYGGTYRLGVSKERSGHFHLRFVDQTNLQTLEQAFETYRPKLILIETPSNPLLRVTDIKAVCKVAQAYGTLVAVDNTFLTPAFQKPLSLGADLVIHSTTKLINGHGDVVAGAVVAKTEALHQELQFWNNCLGLSNSPFDCYLALRGLRTLHLRAKAQNDSAQKVAEFLNAHPAVAKVFYSGLPAHRQHAIAKAQQSGHGIIVSFELHTKDKAHIGQLVDSLELFNLAESLGGIESLICHPATMTHAALNDAALDVAGISKGLLRLSIGLEAAEDLIADLDSSLQFLSPSVVQAQGIAAE